MPSATLDVDVALVDRQGGDPGTGNQDLPEVPAERGPRGGDQPVALRVVEHDSSRSRSVGTRRAGSRRTRLSPAPESCWPRRPSGAERPEREQPRQRRHQSRDDEQKAKSTPNASESDHEPVMSSRLPGLSFLDWPFILPEDGREHHFPETQSRRAWRPPVIGTLQQAATSGIVASISVDP